MNNSTTENLFHPYYYILDDGGAYVYGPGLEHTGRWYPTEEVAIKAIEDCFLPVYEAGYTAGAEAGYGDGI